MRCPYCGHHDLKVVDSRDSEVGEAIRRRRECLQCGQRFTTYERIEAELRRSGRVEIPSGEIGEMVMDRLRDLDEVAYIRFASVYREFMDLQQVKREIEQVLSSRRP